jgi:hypothetical protein
MPFYSICLHGPLLFPLQRPRLKEKESVSKAALIKKVTQIQQTEPR